MKFRVSPRWPLPPPHRFNFHGLPPHYLRPANLQRFLHTARSSANGGGGSSSRGNYFIVPGATAATILMLGALHARRLYDDKKASYL